MAASSELDDQIIARLVGGDGDVAQRTRFVPGGRCSDGVASGRQSRVAPRPGVVGRGGDRGGCFARSSERAAVETLLREVDDRPGDATGGLRVDDASADRGGRSVVVVSAVACGAGARAVASVGVLVSRGVVLVATARPQPESKQRNEPNHDDDGNVATHAADYSALALVRTVRRLVQHGAWPPSGSAAYVFIAGPLQVYVRVGACADHAALEPARDFAQRRTGVAKVGLQAVADRDDGVRTSGSKAGRMLEQ